MTVDMGERFILRESDLEQLLQSKAGSRGYLLAAPYKKSEIYVCCCINAGEGNTFFGKDETDSFVRDFLLFNSQYLAIPYFHERNQEISDANFAEVFAMHDASAGCFRYFCTLYKKQLTIFSPAKQSGISYLQKQKIKIAKDNEIGRRIKRFLDEKKKYILSHLARCI
jgi:hypothetical protein